MKIAIIGGGPAGLRAAEVAASEGHSVTLFDAKASVGRKFLVAGVGGLNLTKQEPPEQFISHYSGAPSPDFWKSLLSEFSPEMLREWAADLDVETFVASTGRVYPKEMKAAPLLRRWVQRLRGRGVTFAMHHRWAGLRRNSGLEIDFETENSLRTIKADSIILALGGGSWPETGSDGKWTTTLEQCGVSVIPLQPGNCGWETAWCEKFLTQAEGLPLKNILARAGDITAEGELLITRYGLEGGALYKLTPALRRMKQPLLEIDFKPELSVERLVAKMGPISRNFLAEARQRWRLSEVTHAILAQTEGQTPSESTESLAKKIKRFPIPLTKPRPLSEAISSAGGVAWEELDENLMLKKIPGVFLAGEMMDWEAPTGGYLIQACFAMGGRAAKNALHWMKNNATEKNS